MSAPNSTSANTAKAAKELQDALNGFNALDIQALTDESVPVEKRAGVAKKASGDVLKAINKLDPLLKNAQGNKEIQDAQATLRKAKVQFTGLDSVLTNIHENEGGVEAFSFGDIFSTIKDVVSHPIVQALPGAIWSVAKTVL
ncbi:hypothetical protein CPB83DRAFT_858264 [Crepidotus variabilis]|uniref:Uncharacterized protein n=1 Tax=Crepidotus variabilis TaxID=179855 RepID=A0A9P6EBA4_9AGAR|nr:hypothetical protein CPB83DRAFT_858264 [Crepidotus variabilis]